MMSTYFDTGALLKLYLEEEFSDLVTDYVTAQGISVAIHAFHEVEMENALRLKVFRREISARQCRGALHRIESDVRDGLLIRRSVDWPDALKEALRISAAVTERSGCRTLDILHVALALCWECSTFLSLDDRQIKAARLVHLKVLDVRTL